MNRAEFFAKATANMRVSGFGIAETTVHIPCPFCAEPDFMVSRVMESREPFSAGATCKHCGRSARFPVESDSDSTRTWLEVTDDGPHPDEMYPA